MTRGIGHGFDVSGGEIELSSSSRQRRRVFFLILILEQVGAVIATRAALLRSPKRRIQLLPLPNSALAPA